MSMKYCSIICSFNSAPLTERVYNQLLKNKKHDIFILENSTEESKMFKRGNVIDMGRENKGFGGMHDFIFRDKRFREYDFVGIFNNDVFDIPEDYIEKMEKYFTSDIGMVSSSTLRTGSGWEHMWRMRKDGFREVSHVEDYACFFNTKLWDKLCEFIPMDFYGILDIVLSCLYKKYGYKLVVVDDTQIGHMLAGAREMAGVKKQYLDNSSTSHSQWLDKHPEIRELYENHIKSISKRVAVIIPNYNHNHLLRNAIQSVIDQDISCDIIVIDDGSPNRDYSCLDGLPVRLFKHDRNRGLAAARNTGISNTKSEWILPLDADDELLPGVVRKLMEGGGDVNYGNLIWRDGLTQMKPNPNVSYDQFLGNNQIFGSSLYKRDIWKEVNYYEEPHEFYEDWDFWARVCKKGYSFKYLDLDVYIYAGDQNGMCARLGREREKNVELVRKHINES